MRILLFFGYESLKDLGHDKIILTDSVVSTGLFIFFFLPFFEELIYF
jgi:hypothetical protein